MKRLPSQWRLRTMMGLVLFGWSEGSEIGHQVGDLVG
jgi:hypothetical protein